MGALTGGSLSQSIHTTQSVASSTTLGTTSASYIKTNMTAIGQCITLPAANALTVLAPSFYIDNTTGTYPVGIRNGAGTLIGVCGAGGSAFCSLQSLSGVAGTWGITGSQLEPGLITIDNTFSSTYLTYKNAFVALDDNISIHFLTIASGFAAVAVNNTTGTVGTPVTVSTTASDAPKIAYKITSTTAIVFYGTNDNNVIGVVITLSGTTTLTVGTPSSTLSATGSGNESFQVAPKIAQLDTTLYMVSYATATGAGTTSVAAWQISSGTTVTLGSSANIIASNNVINSTATYALTSLTAAVVYKSGASAPFTNSVVVVSVTNATPPVCTVGTPAAMTNCQGSTAAVPGSCILSPTSILVADDNNATSVVVNVATISGTTVTAGTAVVVEAATGTNIPAYITNTATRYNARLSPLSATTAMLWYFISTGTISRCCVITNTAGTVTAGTILYNSIATGTDAALGSVLAVGTTEFLVAKYAGFSATTAMQMRVIPHKISGTTITDGIGSPVFGSIGPVVNSATEVTATRLSSGTYIVFGNPVASSPAGPACAVVIKSNGDCVNFCGSVMLPLMQEQAVFRNLGVAPNRIVVMFTTVGSTIDSNTTFMNRLVSIETV